MTRKILITSALPYANGELHLGHIAGAYLPADCYARFERLRGNDVLYICASDEYGVAVTLNAEQSGKEVKDYVDHYHAAHDLTFKKMGISFDHFSRTTSSCHAPFVQKCFSALMAAGYIEKRKTQQLYSKKEKKFFADRYVIGECPRCGYQEARGDECGKCGASYEATELGSPRSKLTGSPLELKTTYHWFLLLERLKDSLSAFLDKKVWSPNVMHFARNYLEEVHARAITRDLSWGVPLPLEEGEGKVFYVWFDAVLGYITATQEWAQQQGKAERWKDYWCDSKTKYVQFIGKDNILFHALFLPAMLLGQKAPYKCVDDLVANEFYNLEGKQFSKSEGWFISLEDFLCHFHVDQIRYTIAANAPETGDSEFSWEEFQKCCNVDLLGKFGNLANRVLTFAQNHCQGKVPSPGPLEQADHRFLNALKRIMEEIENQYASYHLRRSSQLMMELCQEGNIYFNAKAPWKEIQDPLPMQTTIFCCLECLKNLALASFPIIPQTATRLWELLGFSTPLEQHNWQKVLQTPLIEGSPLPKPYLLFQRVEKEAIQREKDKLHNLQKQALQKKAPHVLPLKKAISFSEFQKLDLRVGLVLKVEKVPKSKKLLKLEVDIGQETRTLLSGISHHYPKEELLGKKVIVVANLKPAKIFGIESQGMILAGNYQDSLELVTLENLPPGSEIA